MTKFQSRYGDFNELPQNMLGYQLAQQWKKRLIVLSERELEHLYGLRETKLARIPRLANARYPAMPIQKAS